MAESCQSHRRNLERNDLPFAVSELSRLSGNPA